MWLALFMVLSVCAQEKTEAEQLFQKMETKLETAKTLHLAHFRIQFEERASSFGFKNNDEITGTFAAMSGNKFRLEWRGGKGTDGKALGSWTICDGKQIGTSFSSNEGFTGNIQNAPENGSAPYVAALARPGLFLISAWALPLQDDKGGPKDRWQVSGFKLGNKEEVDELQTQRLDYQLVFKGQVKQSWPVTVWIDVKTDLPIKRRVAMPEAGGKTAVFTETYYRVQADRKPFPKMFEIPQQATELQPRTNIKAGGVNPMAFALSPDGTLLAAAGGRTFGWLNLLDAATLKPTALQGGNPHRGGVGRLVFSPDGKWLASEGAGEVKLWDLTARKYVRSLKQVGDSYFGPVQFSPDSKMLAASAATRDVKDAKNSVGEILLFDLASGKQTASFKGYAGYADSMAFTPDSKTLVVLERGKIKLWDVAGQEKEGPRVTLEHGADAFALSRDGKFLADCGGVRAGFVRLSDTGTGKEIAQFEYLPGRFQRLEFSPDGKTLAAGGDAGLLLLDATTLTNIRTFEPRRYCSALAFSPDGKILASGLGHTSQEPNKSTGEMLFWDVASGRNLGLGKGYAGPVTVLAFSPDGKTLFTAGGEWGDALVKLWDVPPVKEPQKAAQSFKAADYLKVGMLTERLVVVEELIGGINGVPKVGSFATEIKYGKKTAVKGPSPSPLTVSATGMSLATVGPNNSVKIWTIATGDPTAAYLKDGKLKERIEVFLGVNGVAGVTGTLHVVEPDGSWTTSTRFQREDTPKAKGKLSDEQLAQLAKEFARHDLANLPDLPVGPGRFIEIRVGKKLLQAGRAKTDKEKAILGRYHEISQAVTTLCKEPASLTERLELKGQTGAITALAFSADGKALATASADKTVKLWNAGTGAEVRTFQDVPDKITSLAFSHDGRTLAVAGADRKVQLWDVASGKLQGTAKLQKSSQGPAGAEPVALTADGKALAYVVRNIGTRFSTTEVFLLDVATKKETRVFSATLPDTYPDHWRDGSCLAFSADGKTLAVGRTEAGVTLIELASGKLQLGPGDLALCVSISGDGKFFVVAGGDKIRVKEVAGGNKLAELAMPKAAVKGSPPLAVSADGMSLATVGPNNTVKIWTIAMGEVK